ncbi:hypothetical protein ACFWAY_51165 [Rhodococcus sp. NPDC059968]|uniref:hypothetical protein n=1 Tax=Rhodococcus sp. NPDC059968 TaxID=3347017 RepID=UPI0036715AEC
MSTAGKDVYVHEIHTNLVTVFSMTGASKRARPQKPKRMPRAFPLNPRSNFVISNSRVFVSICELGIFGDQLKTFMGLASMSVHSVVPRDYGVVITRGDIG